jgi:hypothetical protein
MAEELIQAQAIIHLRSTISDGKYTVPEIISIARQNNIKIVVITDRDLMRWEFGLWPLRNIIKRVVEDKSVFKYGIGRYLNELKNMQKANPDLVLIPAVESAPFYYWQGSILNNSFKLCNWHKSILVIGLGKMADYTDFPVIGNKRGLVLPFKWHNLLYIFLPVLVLCFGISCLFKRQFSYMDIRGRPLGPYSRRWQLCGIFMMAMGVLLFINNYPFCDYKVDQFKGDLGPAPYQNLIDYVRQRGGLTFWARPEAKNIQTYGMVTVETLEHSGNLLQTRGYTGFAVFYEGYEKIGRPGGLWDELLKEYCQGKRKSPVWGIAGLSFYAIGDLNDYLRDIKTICLIPKLDQADVLNALDNGKVYVIRGPRSSQFVLDKFILRDPLNGTEKTMGEELDLKQKPQVEIKGHFTDLVGSPCKIRLIKNGTIIKTFETASPFDITYEDKDTAKGEKVYYRIEIDSPGALTVSNPIFAGFI